MLICVIITVLASTSGVVKPPPENPRAQPDCYTKFSKIGQNGHLWTPKKLTSFGCKDMKFCVYSS